MGNDLRQCGKLLTWYLSPLCIDYHLVNAIPASDDDSLLAVPRWIVSHDLGVRRDILRRQLRQFIGLRVDPAERLHLLEIFVLRHGVGQMDGLMRAPLRNHHDVADFFDLMM